MCMKLGCRQLIRDVTKREIEKENDGSWEGNAWKTIKDFFPSFVAHKYMHDSFAKQIKGS